MNREGAIAEVDNEIYFTYRKQLRKALIMGIIGGFIWISGGWNESLLSLALQSIGGMFLGTISYLAGGAAVVFFFSIFVRMPDVEFSEEKQISRTDAAKGTAIVLAEGIIALLFCFSIMALFSSLNPVQTFGMSVGFICVGVVVFLVDFFKDIVED